MSFLVVAKILSRCYIVSDNQTTDKIPRESIKSMVYWYLIVHKNIAEITGGKSTKGFPIYRNLGLLAHVPITLSGKKYALNKVYVLNKQVSKYMVMPFSNNTDILSFVFTGYGNMLPCVRFMHL